VRATVERDVRGVPRPVLGRPSGRRGRRPCSGL